MTKQAAILQRLAIATILSVGFAVVWGMAGAWTIEIIERAFKGDRVFEYLRFQPDGTAVIQVYSGSDYPQEQYHDLAGKPVPVGDESKWLTGAYLPVGLSARWWQRGSSWEDRLRAFADQRRPPTYWYFVADDGGHGSAYLVGYDSETRARVGYLGMAGFRKDALPETERFPFPTSIPWAVRTHIHCVQDSYPGPYYPRAVGRGGPGDIAPSMVYVQTSDNRIYEVDLKERAVRAQATNLSVRSSRLVERFHKPNGAEFHRLAIRTDDSIVILDERGQIEHEYSIPEKLRNVDFEWAETTTGGAVAHTFPAQDVLEPGGPIKIYWIDSAGQVTRQAEVSLKSNPSYFRTQLAAMLPIPVASDGFLGVLRPFLLLEEKLAASYGQGLTRAVQELWPMLLITHLLAAGLALLCYRRQVCYAAGYGERILWPLFVFIFGLAGWVGYRFGRSWPVLEVCPACAAVVPRDQVGCAACQADWPPPALTGTEVFG
jgi:hypothetical protein